MSALTAELSPEAKAELAAMFADLRRLYPPLGTVDRRHEPTRQRFAPWQQRRGW